MNKKLTQTEYRIMMDPFTPINKEDGVIHEYFDVVLGKPMRVTEQDLKDIIEKIIMEQSKENKEQMNDLQFDDVTRLIDYMSNWPGMNIETVTIYSGGNGYTVKFEHPVTKIKISYKARTIDHAIDIARQIRTSSMEGISGFIKANDLNPVTNTGCKNDNGTNKWPYPENDFNMKATNKVEFDSEPKKEKICVKQPPHDRSKYDVSDSINRNPLPFDQNKEISLNRHNLSVNLGSAMYKVGHLLNLGLLHGENKRTLEGAKKSIQKVLDIVWSDTDMESEQQPPQRTTPRERVYDAIDSERDYQDAKWGTERVEVPEGLIYLKEHLDRAFRAFYSGETVNVCNTTLSEIRKIAALAVVIMEDNGCCKRPVGD